MIGYRQTQAVANNQLAASQRAAAGKSLAGQGLGRGAGQRSQDQYRQDVARARGLAAGSATRSEDAFFNYGLSMQDRYGRMDDRLAYDTLNEQMRKFQEDSRFNNLTTAWGALAGLLR